MEAVMAVRHLVLAKGESQRAVAERLGISRNTVKRYVKGAPVGARLKTPRRRPKLEGSNRFRHVELRPRGGHFWCRKGVETSSS